MNCPECFTPAIWQSDYEVDDEVYGTTYICFDCKIDITKYWGEKVEDFL